MHYTPFLGLPDIERSRPFGGRRYPLFLFQCGRPVAEHLRCERRGYLLIYSTKGYISLSQNKKAMNSRNETVPARCSQGQKIQPSPAGSKRSNLPSRSTTTTSDVETQTQQGKHIVDDDMKS